MLKNIYFTGNPDWVYTCIITNMCSCVLFHSSDYLTITITCERGGWGQTLWLVMYNYVVNKQFIGNALILGYITLCKRSKVFRVGDKSSLTPRLLAKMGIFTPFLPLFKVEKNVFLILIVVSASLFQDGA